jgi:hypothetical protein
VDRPPETRTYSGTSREAVERAYHLDALPAARYGYVPVDERWGEALGQHHLTVTYRYAPDQAPGVLRMLDSMGLGTEGPASSAGQPNISAAPVPLAPTSVTPTPPAGPLPGTPSPGVAVEPTKAPASTSSALAARWSRLTGRAKVATVVVGILILAVVGSALGGGGGPGSSPTPTQFVGAGSTAAPSTANFPTVAPTVEPTVVATVAPTEPPTPSPPPTPVPTTALAFSPITLRGSGDKVPKFSIPADQAGIATITNRGSANFVVQSIASDGSENDLLVNVIGNYSGTVLFDAQAGEHSVAFKVTSNGSWTIVVKPISEATTWDPSTKLTGKGDNVIVLVPPSVGLSTLTMTNRGQANFVVYGYTADSYDLLINEIGNYSGQVPLADGTLILQIESDGSWTAVVQ